MRWVLISRSYPDVVIDGVEIDSGLISAAKPHFPFSLVKHLNIHISDGRFFLKTTRTQYDVIIVDMFRPPHIPYHVATAEFFAQVKHQLTPNGILAMNVDLAAKMCFRRHSKHGCSGFSACVFLRRYLSPQESSLFTNRLIVASAQNLRLEKSEVEERVFSTPDGAWRKVLDTMRDRQGFDPGQESYFRRVPFDPGKTCFRDDSSALEITAEREFLGLILGGNL